MTIKIIVPIAIILVAGLSITFIQKRAKNRLTLHGRYVL